MISWIKRIFSALFKSKTAAPTQPFASSMRTESVQCLGPNGIHRMSYVEWGDPHNKRILICVHGLTRNARDFDFLAQALSKHYRVVCPDVVGRGNSEWLRVKTDYAIPQYVADMYALIAKLGAKSVDWVGTSMGGLMGMAIAAQPNSPIKRMVLNDVGPLITAQSLIRIGEYVGRAPTFATFAEADAYIRAVSASFGNLTDAQWKHLTEHSIRPAKSGGYVLAYDPGIGDAFRLTPTTADITLWPFYDSIRCPTLVIRGAESDLLTRETVAEMTKRGPHALSVEIANVGHAPMLMDDEQIGVVKRFLLELDDVIS